MKRPLKVLLAVLIVGAGAFAYLASATPRLHLADPDCDDDVEYIMAFNLLSKQLRQDDVGVLDRDGNVTRVTKDHASFDPSFSPDGTKIAFISGREGSHGECCGFTDQAIYVMNVDGSQQRRLSESKGFDQAPAWSPDGDRIAFSRLGQGVMVAPASGGEAELVFEEEKREIEALDWSPDGERLAFATGGDDDAAIHVIDEDGTGHAVVAEELEHIGELAWSPDGESFAFSDYAEIYALSFEEPDPRLLTRDGDTPAWSPEGRFVAYLVEDDDFGVTLWAKPVDGGEAVRLSAEGENLYPFERDLDWLDCR